MASLDPTQHKPARERRRHLIRGAGIFLRQSVATILDMILPPRCVLCGAVVDALGAMCAACWRATSFLAAPWCARCGVPFPYDAGTGIECPNCIARPPSFDRARSVMIYDDHSRRLVLALKHGDQLHVAPAVGNWLARAGAELLAEADLVVPVPLHWTRLWRRRYNQSAVMAHALAEALRRHGGPVPAVAPDLLMRARPTPSQGHLTRRQRALNVRGAFRLKPGQMVRGLHIVLIDDVLTSGATVEECAKVLRGSGAGRIDVLTLARAVRSG